MGHRNHKDHGNRKEISYYDKIYATTAFFVNEYTPGSPSYIYLAEEYLSDPNRLMWAFYDVVDPMGEWYSDAVKDYFNRDWEKFIREQERLKRGNKPNPCP